MQLLQLLNHHQTSTWAMTLPDVKVPAFSGNPVEYCYFIQCFENLIVAKTASHSARLFYLVQYTSREAQELMRSCLTMTPEEGYEKAKNYKYGQDYDGLNSLSQRALLLFRNILFYLQVVKMP